MWPLDATNLSLIQFPPLSSCWGTFSLKTEMNRAGNFQHFKENYVWVSKCHTTKTTMVPWWRGSYSYFGVVVCIPTTEISKIVHNRMLTSCAWILGAFIKSSGHNGAKYCVCLAWKWGLFWRRTKVNCQMHWHLQRGAIQVINQILSIFFQRDCCIQMRYL